MTQNDPKKRQKLLRYSNLKITKHSVGPKFKIYFSKDFDQKSKKTRFFDQKSEKK